MLKMLIISISPPVSANISQIVNTSLVRVSYFSSSINQKPR